MKYSNALAILTKAGYAGFTVLPAPARLNVARNGNQLTISWIGERNIIQTNSNLANPAGWTDVVGNQHSPFTVSLPATGTSFYRLKGQ